jgi:ribonuclease HIII
VPVPSARPTEVRAAVAALTDACTAAGFQVTGVCPIDYGLQLAVSDGSQVANVNVYGGRKGVRTVINGAPGASLYRALAGIVEARPQVAVEFAQQALPLQQVSHSRAGLFPPGPWIGSDESGKGDYFGPLVAAAVFVSPDQESQLRVASVRDSKLLTDAMAHDVAAAVRHICEGRFAEEVISPAEYNALYERFKASSENLNHLLAWGHVHVLEPLLASCNLPIDTVTVIADQFANERYVRERLHQALDRRDLPMPRLVQMPRAEANVAVAAASILARDRFLRWLEEASAHYGIKLPKGGSNPAIIAAARHVVQRYGAGELANVAKLHFATTGRVVGRAAGQ